mgnify:FL=1
MSGHFGNCAVERREYAPADSDGQAIGHLGFFRERHAHTLWPQVTQWLTQQAGERS